MEIKDWLDELLSSFGSLPADTHYDVQKKNRVDMGSLIRSKITSNEAVIDELKVLLDEWDKYFDEGYYYPLTIEGLIEAIKKKILECYEALEK